MLQHLKEAFVARFPDAQSGTKLCATNGEHMACTSFPQAFNLGTGQGSSVLEVIAAFEKASGIKIPFKVVQRRQGDVDQLFAVPTRAEEELGWKAEKSLLDMCKDMWNWQKKNPHGFSGTAN